MKQLLALPLALLTLAAAAPPPDPATRATRWWADIGALADDRNEGRLTGSAGYLRAAGYVEGRFEALGLAPAGDGGGYRQSVAFESQAIDPAASTAMLSGKDGAATPLRLPEDMIVAAGGGPRPATVEAPLVFVGYGLHLPDLGHDDFAGLDLRGKIAVVISGGPADLPGPAKAAARSDRAKLLAQAGAIGIVSITTPKQIEIPWERQKLLSGQPGMYLADAALRETPDGFLLASVDPAFGGAAVRRCGAWLRRTGGAGRRLPPDAALRLAGHASGQDRGDAAAADLAQSRRPAGGIGSEAAR